MYKTWNIEKKENSFYDFFKNKMNLSACSWSKCWIIVNLKKTLDIYVRSNFLKKIIQFC